jgi:hypothetical protein
MGTQLVLPDLCASMKTQILALCAMSGLCACINAADVTDAPLAVYYSFETAPPAPIFTEMRSEMTRILAPAHLQVAWRSLNNRSPEGEDFREVVVLRFRGTCSLDKTAFQDGTGPSLVGLALAETELVDGHVLPFGEVQCDKLRRFIAPAARKLDSDAGNVALGRAMARVGAHELYHMLTHSGAHARTGIARAEHSRAELTGASFDFARPDTDWLRAWVDKQPLATASLEPVHPETDEPPAEASSDIISVGTR